MRRSGAVRVITAAILALGLTACEGREAVEIPDGEGVVFQFHSPDAHGVYLFGVHPGEYLSTVPRVTAYADGRVLVTDGRAGQVPVIRQGTLDPSELADLLRQAGEAGLLAAEPDLGNDKVDISHPSVTVVTIGTSTATHTISVLELGADGSFSRQPSRGQLRARDTLHRIRDRLRETVQAGSSDYLPHEVAALVWPEGSEAFEELGDLPDGSAEATDWPLDLPLSDVGVIVRGMLNEDPRCLTITGDDVHLIWGTATSATTHVWVDGGGRFDVFLRPALPDESDLCSTLAS